MLQNHKWNTPQHAFEPLNMLAHLQTYANNILRGNHFDVLISTNYKERYNALPNQHYNE